MHLANSYALINRQKKHLNTLLSPLREHPISVLRKLQDLASVNRIDINWRVPWNQRPHRKQEEGEQVSYQLMTVELEGQYRNLRDYLEGVCHLEQILGIESYEIETTGGNGRDPASLRTKLLLQFPSRESNHDEKITNP